MNIMSKEAIVSYITKLRAIRRLTLSEVATRAGEGVDVPFLQRLEAGGSVGYFGLIKVVEALEGNLLHLPALAAEGVTEQEGAALAELWAAQGGIPVHEREAIKQLLKELEQDGVMDIVRRLRGRQKEYERWIGIGQGLALQSGS